MENLDDLFGEEIDDTASPEGDAIDQLPASLLPGFSGAAKEKYRVLVRTLCQRHPDWSPEHAIAEIRRVESACGYSFYQVQYNAPPQSPGEMMNRHRALRARKLLDLLEPDENIEREAIEEVIKNMGERVSQVTGDSAAEAEQNFVDLATYGAQVGIHTRAEIQDLLVNGPRIEGFETSEDLLCPNEEIRVILKDLFGEQMYRRAKIVRISKDDRYLIHRTANDPVHIQEGNELITRGLVVHAGTFLAAKDRASYLEAECFLEGVTDPTKLRHIYKLRAQVSGAKDYNVIQLNSFGVEHSADYDYLAELEGMSETEKMRLYILSTIVHEFGHAFELQIDRAFFRDYQTIIAEERAPEVRERFVSDYVVRHAELYRSDEYLLAREDIAEAIRIYTVNPDYLERHFPRRHAFIQQHFTFIKRGGLLRLPPRPTA